MTIDDKIYDRFLNTIRDGEADVGTIDIRIDGRWQTIDFRPALARLVAERDDAIEQARRLDELYEAACADIGDLQGKMDRLRAEVDSLVEAADAARLLLLFAAGPHEAGAVPAMLAAAIERAKGVKDAKGEK